MISIVIGALVGGAIVWGFTGNVAIAVISTVASIILSPFLVALLDRYFENRS